MSLSYQTDLQIQHLTCQAVRISCLVRNNHGKGLSTKAGGRSLLNLC